MNRFTVLSTSFNANQAIPRKYTAEGDNVSPHVSWTGFPKEAKGFVLLFDDPDAPRAEPHWLLYNIPGSIFSSPEGAAKGDRLKGVAGAVQGKNSYESIGYRGPQPPPGQMHKYRFQVFALDEISALPPGAGKAEIWGAIEGHVLAVGELFGTYRR